MNILVIGGGGREHALAWKLAQSARVEQIWVAPGNAGTAQTPRCRNVPIAATDIAALLQLAQDAHIDLTVVGPEAPLVAGIVDRFRAQGRRIFGPTAAAAQLEGSKAYAKTFMQRYGIPTAAHASFTELKPALAYVRQHGAPIVVKADGLAAGKGVILAQTLEEAEAAVRSILADQVFGEAGRRVVIEDFLQGEEASFICMVDGEHILPLASSQDHKARDAGDQGPNTGGMGAYSPAPVITPELHERIMQQVLEPVVAGLRAEGEVYTGFLYAGVMIDAQGQPQVLEFNCRFGDPETQPILMRLRSDLLDLLEAGVDGCLDQVTLEWDPRIALGVVLAAGGYPEAYRKGDVIHGLENTARQTAVQVFHAGTKLAENAPVEQVITDGGRVLCVVGLGETYPLAQQTAYQACESIQFADKYYRPDIGYRAIARG